jgi:hypothetical protein
MDREKEQEKEKVEQIEKRTRKYQGKTMEEEKGKRKAREKRRS